MVHFKIKYKIYTLTMKIAHDFFKRIPTSNYTSKFPGKRSCNLLHG